MSCDHCHEDFTPDGWFEVSGFTPDGVDSVTLCSDSCMAMFCWDIAVQYLEEVHGVAVEEALVTELDRLLSD